MADRKLKWSASNLTPDGTLTVPIEPPVDDGWANAFKQAGTNLMRETRGQRFRDVTVDDSGLTATGLDVSEPKPTADFFDVWVSQTNAHVEQWRKMHEQAAQQNQVRSEKATADAERSAQALRER